MAKRRGFVAELNRTVKQAEARQRQQQAATARAAQAAERAAQRARKEQEQAHLRALRAHALERQEAEKEAARLHADARSADVEARNARLAQTYEEIDNILFAALAVDDFIDLDTLKVEVKHPSFNPGAVGRQQPRRAVETMPVEPQFKPVPEPTGMTKIFGGKKRHEAESRAAWEKFQADHAAWQRRCAAIDWDRVAAQREWEEAERVRLAELERLRSQYQTECTQREQEAAQQNAAIDEFKNNLAFDVPEAIEEYIQLVLHNSVYPNSFPVTARANFNLESREMSVTVQAPKPDEIPTTKAYRYVKTRDEITSTDLSIKAYKDRYNGAIWQVAIRTLHEIFEADRSEKIHSISLRVQVDGVSEATGAPETIPLVQAAADRDTFMTFNLRGVVPRATLEHLGAALSPSPFDLRPATVGGVRKRASK